MEKHFVRFISAGSFTSEETIKEIDCWDVQKAIAISKKIVERHGAKPYGFQFITRSRKDDELDSRVIKRSGIYYIDGIVETLDEIKAKKSPSNQILISNMECNRWDKVVITKTGWTLPFNEDDHVINL